MIKYVEKIKDLFNFNSELSCRIDLISLEELLFNKLKNSNLDVDNILRWNEFKEMSFDLFFNDAKYRPEQLFITNYIIKLMSSKSERVINLFYNYNKSVMNKSNKCFILEEGEGKYCENQLVYFIIGPEAKIEETKKIKYGMKKRKFSENDIENQQETNGQKRIKRIRTYSTLNCHKKDSSDEDSTNGLKNEFEIKVTLDYSSITVDNNEVKDNDDAILSKNLNSCNIKKVKSSPLRLSFHQYEHNFNDDSKLNQATNTSANSNVAEIDNLSYFQGENQTNMLKPMHKNNINSLKFYSILSNMRGISKYYNLCPDFKRIIKSHHFLDTIEECLTLKLNKLSIERIFIPQFRDLNIQTELLDTETNLYDSSSTEIENPIFYNIKKILFFIAILILLFIGVILTIFLIN